MKEELMDALGDEIEELKHFGEVVRIAVTYGNGTDYKVISWTVDEQIRHITERLERIYDMMADEALRDNWVF